MKSLDAAMQKHITLSILSGNTKVMTEMVKNTFTSLYFEGGGRNSRMLHPTVPIVFVVKYYMI